MSALPKETVVDEIVFSTGLKIDLGSLIEKTSKPLYSFSGVRVHAWPWLPEDRILIMSQGKIVEIIKVEKSDG